MVAAVTFLETLKADAENLVESDLPSAQDVRPVLAALVKRVEGLLGLDVVEPAPVAEPAPVVEEPPAPAAEAEPTAEEPAATETAAEPDAEAAKAARKAELEAELAALEAQP